MPNYNPPWNKGKRWSETHNTPHPFLGRHHTAESRAKMSVVRKGKKLEEIFGPEKAAELRAKKSEQSSGERNNMYGVSLVPWNKGKKGCFTEETRRMMSVAQQGPNHPWRGKKRPEHSAKMKAKGNPNYGRPPRPTYTCTLKGHMVRSRWEKVMCDWLYVHGVEYVYEGRSFQLSDGKGAFTYIPDIYIPSWDEYWEVKGYWSELSIRKVDAFMLSGKKLLVIDGDNIKSFMEVGA